MIRLEDVAQAAKKHYRDHYGSDPDATEFNYRTVACAFAALVDEINAEFERVAGATLERVGARDLTEKDIAAVLAKPAEPPIHKPCGLPFDPPEDDDSVSFCPRCRINVIAAHTRGEVEE